MTPANVHDGEMFRQVLSGDEKWAFADKAYDSEKNHKILEEKKYPKWSFDKGNQEEKAHRNRENV
jgi:IS5 family transposase